MLRRISLLIAIAALPALRADITPHALFSAHAVLQRAARVPVWGSAAPGEKITVALGAARAEAIAAADGRWRAELTGLAAGGPFTLTLTGDKSPAPLEIADVLVGETWLCAGGSNMEMAVARGDRPWCGVKDEAKEVAAASFPQLRVFTVEPKLSETPLAETTGQWVVCSPETVGAFSAAAYFFGREIFQTQKVPVGLVVAALGSSSAEAWTSLPALEKQAGLRTILSTYTSRKVSFNPQGANAKIYQTDLARWQTDAAAAKAGGRDRPREPQNPDPAKEPGSPAVLFNGTLAPLIPFAIRGVVWYQGEANVLTPDKYALLLQTLIADWRARWGAGDFPFLLAQLANHQNPSRNPNTRSPLAPLRDAQLQTSLAVPATGLAVLIDLGEIDNPTPRNKQEASHRLALLARAQAYGEKIESTGPIFKSARTEDGAVRLSFTHIGGGLALHGTELQGFALAGTDGKFEPADAVIEGDTVVVANGGVVLPAQLRYGWADNPLSNLYNGAGLPASPFRTDLKTARDTL